MAVDPSLPDVRDEARKREQRNRESNIVEHCQERHCEEGGARTGRALQNAAERERCGAQDNPGPVDY